jgi:hypothetical protein
MPSMPSTSPSPVNRVAVLPKRRLSISSRLPESSATVATWRCPSLVQQAQARAGKACPGMRRGARIFSAKARPGARRIGLIIGYPWLSRHRWSSRPSRSFIRGSTTLPV